MSNAIKELKPNQSTDLVLQEIWRIKDTLSTLVTWSLVT